MKGRIFYKGLGFLCILSLIVGLVSACNSKSVKVDSKEGPDKKLVSNVDGDGKYTEGIKISFVRGIDDDLASNILPKTPGETVEDNRWLDAYRDILGIDVTYDWIVKGNETSDAFVQKLNVTLASGELPDVILVNPSQLKQLAEADMIMDMTPYYKEYGSELLKDIYTQEGDGLLNSVTFDGKLMAIPDMVSMVETTQYLWIRNDWLDNLGLKPPTTMEELLVIIEAFTTQDPDGNGIDDTLGLAITKELYGGAMGLEGFFAGYGAYPNIWVEDDKGDLVYGSVLPEVKEALAEIAKMYQKGYIDKEFGIKDGGKVSENIVAGMYGVEYGQQWNPMWPLINNYNNDPKAEWTAYGIVAKEGKKCMVPLSFTSSRYFAVRKDFEHPEALVKMCNLHVELNWGQSNDFNKYYMPVENGGVGVWKFSPVAPFPPFKNYDAFVAIEEARKTGDFSQLTGEPKVIQGNIQAYENGDTSQWGWERIYGENGAFRILADYLENDQLLREKFVGAPTDTMTEKLSTLRKMEVEEFVKIIMGESTIESFDAFVENWYKLGGEAITKEVNEWYDSLK